MVKYGIINNQLTLKLILLRTRYGLYQEAVGLCKTIEEDKWSKAIYHVFDAPGIPNEPFEV